MRLPYLLVDVDGVLVPWEAETRPDGFEDHRLEGRRVWLSPRHGEWLHRLAGSFRLVWTTGWQHAANRLLSPHFGLPQLPTVVIPPEEFDPFDKLPAVRRFVDGSAAAWIDDDLSDQARAWAATRVEPTLLIDIDPAVGLTEDTVDKLEAWAADLG